MKFNGMHLFLTVQCEQPCLADKMSGGRWKLFFAAANYCHLLTRRKPDVFFFCPVFMFGSHLSWGLMTRELETIWLNFHQTSVSLCSLKLNEQYHFSIYQHVLADCILYEYYFHKCITGRKQEEMVTYAIAAHTGWSRCHCTHTFMEESKLGLYQRYLK